MLHNYISPPFSIARTDFYIFSGISFFFPYIIPSSVFNSSSREESSEEEIQYNYTSISVTFEKWCIINFSFPRGTE